MNNTGNASQVYVDLEQLADWGNMINNLNDEANDILKAYEQTVDDLDNYWKGNFASGYIDDCGKFTQKAKNCHNAMKAVPEFVKDYINKKDLS